MSDVAAGTPPKGVVADLQHPTDIVRSGNFAIQGLCIGLASLFVFTRFISKIRAAGFNFAVDDYFTLISYLSLLAYCICGIVMSVYGGGYHVWEVPSTHIQPFFKAAYIATIVYCPAALLIKLVLLTIIARVFSPYRKTVLFIYALDGILIAYYVAQLIVKIRVCWPISAYWKGESEKCLDQTALITADAIMSMVSDTILLFLPLPLTWSLQLPNKKKLRVAGMLCIGGIATAFSIWRLHLIRTEGKSPDQTVAFIKIVWSGNGETVIGLICTCLPAAAALFHKVRDATGYGSSQRQTGSRAYKMSHLSSNPRGPKHFDGSDEAGLVSHAQGQVSLEQDIGHTGIMRKVEVTHEVSSVESKDYDERKLDFEDRDRKQ